MTKQNNGLGGLFKGLPEDTTLPVTKSEFARRVGLSKGRISQLVQEGLPVRPDGKIDPTEGAAWMESNGYGRRRPNRSTLESPSDERRAPAGLTDLRAQKLEAEVDRLRLELAQKTGELIDRTKVEKVIFERARRERDEHSKWVVRVAPILAGEFGLDERRIFHALDQQMRRHLERLSDAPLEVLRDGDDRSLGR